MLDDKRYEQLIEVGSPGGVPERIGPYRVEGVIGRGAQAIVFRGMHINLRRPTAIKVLLPEYANDEVYTRRFHREAHFAARLAHHNIVTVYDSGVTGDFHWMGMELVQGRSLDELVELGPLPPQRAGEIVLEVARALAAAAELDILHRDVKTANILLNQEGIAKLADLGVAKIRQGPGETAAGTAGVGSPSYISPEMAMAEVEPDIRSDIYSLGIVLYELTTGERPLEGGNVMQTLLRHHQEDVPPPSLIAPHLPKAIDAFVALMCARNRDDRYPDVPTLIADLETWLAGQTPPTAGALIPPEPVPAPPAPILAAPAPTPAETAPALSPTAPPPIKADAPIRLAPSASAGTGQLELAPTDEEEEAAREERRMGRLRAASGDRLASPRRAGSASGRAPAGLRRPRPSSGTHAAVRRSGRHPAPTAPEHKVLSKQQSLLVIGGIALLLVIFLAIAYQMIVA